MTARLLPVSDHPEPVAVIDAHDPLWRNLPKRDRQVLRWWALAQCIDPDVTWRIEVYLVDCPFARVFQYATNDQGHRYVDPPGSDRVAQRDPFTVPLRDLPPPVGQWEAVS